ncbi:juvenile hormone acid O-methyltransferase-like isoform X2 [Tubulanus polymorphus]|uniref:juvenile hormone acid O-methyltransferase-like isoform X2 n=1 Tax=Tubulanus polymorphus TaxID=672921 RepID=UPI003DA4BDA8
MNPNAENYSKNNNPQRKWARNTLSLIEFQQNSYRNVLDIGCGSGEVTNILLNHINNVENLIAFDKHESMVEFARAKNPNPKIEYLVADVTKPDSFRPEWRQKFDLITSFIVLHWTPNQYSNLEHIKSLLSPNGEVVISIPFGKEAFSHLGDVADLPKWSPYFQGFTAEWTHNPEWEEFSEWRFPDKETGYRRMAESLGFTVKRCTLQVDQDLVFPDLQSAKGMIGAILPHSKRIPEGKFSEFMDDTIEIYLQHCPLNENGKVHVMHDVLVVHLQNNA